MIIALTISMSALLGGGCSAKHPRAHVPGQVEVPRECITAIELSDKTECHGKPGEVLNCTGLRLTYKVGCERLNVKEKK